MTMTSYNKLFFFGVYLYLFSHFIVSSALNSMSYYRLRAYVPLILFCITRMRTFNVKLKHFYLVPTLFSIPVFAWLKKVPTPIIKFNSPPRLALGFSFHYFVIIEYLVFAVIIFELFRKKLGNDIESLAYTVTLLPVAGMIYELPIHSNFRAFSSSFPLFFRSSLILLVPLCHKIQLSIFLKPTVLLALLLLTSFSVFYYFSPSLPFWLPRLPTLVFWAFVVANMKNQKQI